MCSFVSYKHLVSVPMLCFLYLTTGILNRGILVTALFLSFAVFLGMLIGIRVDSNLKEETVRKSIIALLIISGTILIKIYKNGQETYFDMVLS